MITAVLMGFLGSLGVILCEIGGELLLNGLNLEAGYLRGLLF